MPLTAPESAAAAAGEPLTELDSRFSEPEAAPTPWAQAERMLTEAELFWLSTVRPDGFPHVTPLIAVWLEGALYFCSGPGERKVGNLSQNPRCVLTTGSNTLGSGLDLVLEGRAVRVLDDDAKLHRVAAAYLAKYGKEWAFQVRDGAFFGAGGGGTAWVYEVAPAKGFGFAKGRYGQTRWTFSGGV
ncbi:pyridoxamine 5'-phosphate oxidase family protein [Streptacidiphilus sp. PAMC 29251]